MDNITVVKVYLNFNQELFNLHQCCLLLRCLVLTFNSKPLIFGDNLCWQIKTKFNILCYKCKKVTLLQQNLMSTFHYSNKLRFKYFDIIVNVIYEKS